MTAPSNRFRLAAMGDVMLARDVGRHFTNAPADFDMPDIRAVLGEYDLVCANLECPVATSGRPHPVQDPQVTFRAHPDTLAVLQRLGVTQVTLGNNHMLDYGEPALVETLERLDAAGIGRVGAGRDYEEANRPLVIHRNGRRIAFLSYALIYSANSRMAGRRRPGTSDHRMRRVLPLVRELRAAGHDVIIFLHWGHEYSFYPVPYQMRQARRMIDEGAALVIGHGPHYPQGIEEYNGGRIVYSLGNFIFDEPYKFANRSFIYGVEVAGGAAAAGTVYPVHLTRHVPALVSGDRQRRLLGLVNKLGTTYPRKDERFWRGISDAYLGDILWRVVRNRSPKYVFVPPLSFYRDVGAGGLLRRLRIGGLVDLMRAMATSTVRRVKSGARLLLPVSLRLRLARWLSARGRDSVAVGLIRDLQVSDPKTFHKFLWSHHLMDYARWYDSAEELFAPEQMQPSRRELFNDLVTVLRREGVEPAAVTSVLEVGCSLGYLLRHLETDVFREARDLVGIDIDGEGIAKGADHLRRLGSRVTLMQGDMEDVDRLLGPRTFDVVLAAGVLSYLDEVDASRVVSVMLRRTKRVLALAGLACLDRDNATLEHSELSTQAEGQWLHNFEAMVASAGGRVVKSRWEGAREFNRQTIHFVFAVPQ